MAHDEAYREAEQEIEKARRSGATEFELRQSYHAKDSEKLTELPESLWELTTLQTLNLSGNQLTALPEAIGQLTTLQTLNLRSNHLTNITRGIEATYRIAVFAYRRQ
jgi:Leucine-rich repeat (LRR) protein